MAGKSASLHGPDGDSAAGEAIPALTEALGKLPADVVEQLADGGVGVFRQLLEIGFGKVASHAVFGRQNLRLASGQRAEDPVRLAQLRADRDGLYLPIDEHFSALGHRVTAELLADGIVARGWVR